MAVFRVERNTGYTVMSNHHLRNKELSLKAKGLLSQMLSLPEDWDYTLAGLSHINREKIDAIREAVKELEKAGYIVRSRERDEKGRLRGADYVIYEQPQPREPEAATSGGQPPILDLPTLENPTLDNPTLEKPTQEKPTLENPTQLNKDILSKEQSITDLSSTDSIPFHSLNPLPFAHGEAATPPERKRTEAKSNSAVEIYREIIKDNIEYDHLIQNCKIDKDRLDEIVDLMLETVCTARKTIRIAGDDYPAELVKSKFLKLNSSHIEFVLDCMRENTTKVRNIKQYLKAVLFNAPSTIDSYYNYYILHVDLENFNLSHVPVYIMGEEQLSMYAMYMSSLGNRPDLFPQSGYVSKYYENPPADYEVPAALLGSDEKFARLMEEADKYVGFPYVWGGSTPETSFDCSGFVSYVLTNSGLYNTGRLGAQGLYNISTPVSNPQPGDLVFFTGTYDTPGVSHVGIYVGEDGDGSPVMLHCGDPIQYSKLDTSYWQSHFYAYGRLSYN